VYYAITITLITLFFILVPIYYRYKEIQKTMMWEVAEGVVEGSKYILLGEDSVVFIDATYFYNGKKFKARNLNTGRHFEKDFPRGKKVNLLVNPESPEVCLIRKDFGIERIADFLDERMNRK
jgi:hypothetical protein